MIELMFAETLAAVLLNEQSTTKLKELQCEALKKVYNTVSFYRKHGFIEKLVEAVFSKKIQFIMQATTKSELQMIAGNSKPVYNGRKFIAPNCYHVEEEELLLWSLSSLNAPLIHEGVERFQELFNKYCGELKCISSNV